MYKMYNKYYSTCEPAVALPYAHEESRDIPGSSYSHIHI